MRAKTFFSAIAWLLLCSSLANAEPEEDHVIELETTVIHGNKEQPQILYIVPWQEQNNNARKIEQKLVLHSLFGDLFDPIAPKNVLID